MALNGTIKSSTATVVSSDKYPRHLVLEWNATQNIENNTSTITYTLKAGGNSTTSWCNTGKIKVTLDGTTIYEKSSSFQMFGQQVLKSGSLTVSHNAEGKKTVRATIQAAIYTTGTVNSTADTTFTLNTIPRTSTVSCSTADIGSNPTISISRASSSFTHTIRYEFYGLSNVIAQKTSAVTITNWTIPTSFYAKIPNAKYGTGTIYCDTYMSATLIGTSSTTFRVNVNEAKSKPVLSPTIIDTNDVTRTLTGDENVLVKYFSNATVSSGVGVRNGATLKEQSITCGKATIEASSGVFKAVESGSFNFSATDSRGFVTNLTINKPFVEYVKLTCNLTVQPITTSGDITFTINGNYFNEVFGLMSNNLIVEYRYKTLSGSWSSWIVVSPDVEGHGYTVTETVSGLDYKTKYNFQARASDKLMVTSQTKQAQSVPIFDWGENDFAFNVPVSIEGDPVNDYVVEYGTESMGSNGTWYWSKWKSGKSECYGCRNYGNMAVTTAWGVLYRSEIFTQDIPFGVFNNTPEVIDVTFRNSNFGGWIAKHEQSAPSTMSTGSFILVRPASATLSQAYISFHIVGRWK